MSNGSGSILLARNCLKQTILAISLNPGVNNNYYHYIYSSVCFETAKEGEQDKQ
jgi:hypothetical protein